MKSFKKYFLGPPISIMAILLDSHVVDCSSSPGPRSLNSRWVRMLVCPRSWEENAEVTALWPSPLAVISRFLSLCLSLSFSRAHAPYSKKLRKQNKKQTHIRHVCVCLCVCVCAQNLERRMEKWCAVAISLGGRFLTFCIWWVHAPFRKNLSPKTIIR